MHTRRLVLRKETLTELHTEELESVVGAAATTPLIGCLKEAVSRVVACPETDSILRPCISNGCTR